MSKAEERANEKYPLMQEGDQEGLEALKYIGIECDSVYEFNSVRYSQQAYFIEGYHQAEKDLELTVDDIMKIDALLIEMWNNQSENKYQEVLKRFKSYGKKEI
jgi:hypothetical protein